MGIFEGVARKLNPTGRAHHSAGRKAEDVSAPEGEHTRRSSGGAGAQPPAKTMDVNVRWYAELVAVAVEQAAKTRIWRGHRASRTSLWPAERKRASVG